MITSIFEKKQILAVGKTKKETRYKEGEYYWWRAKESNIAELCKIRKSIHTDKLYACFFNKSHISEPFWGIFTPAEIKPFKEEGEQCYKQSLK